MIQTNISLPEELHQKVKEYGFKNKLSLSAVVRQALENFLNKPQIVENGNGTYKHTVTPELPKPIAKPIVQKKAPFSNYQNKGSIPFA